MFGLRTAGKQAFVSRRIGVFVPSRCRGLRFGGFRRRPPPGLERKPGFRLSARAFKCHAAGFQRTLAHARNEALDSKNARSGRNDGARKYLNRPRKAGTNSGENFIPKTGGFSSPQVATLALQALSKPVYSWGDENHPISGDFFLQGFVSPSRQYSRAGSGA